jgi:hypothetical protein
LDIARQPHKRQDEHKHHKKGKGESKRHAALTLAFLSEVNTCVGHNGILK